MEVARKDGLLLVRDLAVEVKNHMDFKINAVMVSPFFRSSYLFLLLCFEVKTVESHITTIYESAMGNELTHLACSPSKLS